MSKQKFKLLLAFFSCFVVKVLLSALVSEQASLSSRGVGGPHVRVTAAQTAGTLPTISSLGTLVNGIIEI